MRELIEHVVVGNRFTAFLLAGVGRDAARAALSSEVISSETIRSPR